MRKEIFINKSKEFSVEAAGNKITSIRDKDITKKSIRVFKNNRIFSSSFVGRIDNDFLMEKATSNLNGAVEFDYELDKIKDVSEEKLLTSKNEKDFYNEYEEALQALSKKHPDFIFSGKAIWNQIDKTINYVDEGKQKLLYDDINWYFIYKHKKSSSMMDGYFGEDNIASFDIHTKINEYSNYLSVFNTEVSLKSGKMPVVFAQPSMLLGKTLESMRSDNYQKGIGVFKHKLGEKILSEKLSLYDVSFDPEIGAMNLFDSEGYVRDKNYLELIEKGIFKNIITDSRNAKKYSLSKTGNGHRSFDTNTSLGFNTLTMGNGARSSNDILNNLDKCILVELAAGGDFTDTGDYSTPIQGAYLLENGVPKGRIPQVTLTTSIQKMFGDDLIEVASDSISMIEKKPAIFINAEIMIN